MSKSAQARAIPIVREALRAAMTLLDALDEPAESTRGPALIAVHEALNCTRRYAAGVCRTGAIVGAAMIARTWSATPAAIEAYVATKGRQTPRRAAPIAVDDEHDLDAVLAELGAERVSRRRSSTAR